MDERLRGKGDFSVEEIMAFSARKDDWIDLEKKLNEDYLLEKIIIKDSPSQGWGINYRVGKNSLCYVHPEKTSLFVAFQITEAKMNEIKPFLVSMLGRFGKTVILAEKAVGCGTV